MTIAISENEQVLLEQVLVAYIEEWGAENVSVSVPSDWKSLGTTSLGEVRLEFAGDDVIAVSVEHGYTRLNYQVVLRKDR